MLSKKHVSTLITICLLVLFASSSAFGQGTGKGPTPSTGGVDISSDLESIGNLIVFITKWVIDIVFKVGVAGLVSTPLAGFVGIEWKKWLGWSFVGVAVKIFVGTLLALAGV